MESSESKKSARFISQPALRKNLLINQHSMTMTTGLAGATAGIIGLTGLSGFAFFFVAGFVLIALLQMKAGFNWEKFFPSYKVLMGGWVTAFKTYILFWTFLYGMIHIY
ncbi:Oidioi.mRNA.OKI2018_I69.XSR.g14674.t1.cds [Oikopleura dioica]|uniref:ER membrane protein complex subunit 6 n=1 Tax=Oikopleura dioica TaxID=34765 RepID=A0ABN7SEI1_OIKDI|nr:Oidioi.mRNA.OKI2018_I69.XSR.g14674.t1.cds [Oikopleura dioica]